MSLNQTRAELFELQAECEELLRLAGPGEEATKLPQSTLRILPKAFVHARRPTFIHLSSSILIHSHPSSSILIHPHLSASILIHPHPSLHPSIHPSIHPCMQTCYKHASLPTYSCGAVHAHVRLAKYVCWCVNSRYFHESV